MEVYNTINFININFIFDTFEVLKHLSYIIYIHLLYFCRDLSGKGDNWHLDKYISPSLHIFNISNLGFLLDDNEQAARLRQAIVLLELPTYASKLSSKILKLGKDLLQPLNSGQKSAIFKALAADHYVLFKGMPGTGTVLVTLILLVLLCSLLIFLITVFICFLLFIA